MDNFLSGNKRALDDSQASTSTPKSVVTKIKSRKYSQDDNSSKNGNSKQFKKCRKAQLQSKVCFFFLYY